MTIRKALKLIIIIGLLLSTHYIKPPPSESYSNEIVLRKSDEDHCGSLCTFYTYKCDPNNSENYITHSHHVPGSDNKASSSCPASGGLQSYCEGTSGGIVCKLKCEDISDQGTCNGTSGCFYYRGGRTDDPRCVEGTGMSSCGGATCYSGQLCHPYATKSGSSSYAGSTAFCGGFLELGEGEKCENSNECIGVLKCEGGISSPSGSGGTCSQPTVINDKQTLTLPPVITCDKSELTKYSSVIPIELRPLLSSSSISCVSSLSNCTSNIGYPVGAIIPGTNTKLSCATGGGFCCASATPGPAGTGTTCEDPASANGRIWDCRASCSPGVVGGTGGLFLCPNIGESCCDMGPSGSGGGTSGSTPTTPTETCTYYGVSCKSTTDAADVVKSGSSETAPYKSGGQCGGNYQDVYECVNSTTGAKRLDSRPVPASNAVCAPGGSWCAVSSSPCQSKGGLMGGVAPIPKCGNTPYDSTNANKTQAQGNPYCGKTYSVDYQCSDGTWEPRTTGYTPGICDALPWCNTATATSGTGEACPGAPSAVGGNCTSDKPICNRSGTQGDCVAQASVGATQFCAKASACQSNTCTAQACAASGGATPTAQPLSIDVYCPVVDTDGKPNTCYGSSTCPTGYTLKSSPLAHQACSAHTSGLNPYCCHKDTTTGSSGGALSPACPNIDTDGKPNSCADKRPASSPGANCPAGYTYKNAAQGDSDCTDFRGTPSVCCHQGGGA